MYIRTYVCDSMSTVQHRGTHCIHTCNPQGHSFSLATLMIQNTCPRGKNNTKQLMQTLMYMHCIVMYRTSERTLSQCIMPEGSVYSSIIVYIQLPLYINASTTTELDQPFITVSLLHIVNDSHQ